MFLGFIGDVATPTDFGGVKMSVVGADSAVAWSFSLLLLHLRDSCSSEKELPSHVFHPLWKSSLSVRMILILRAELRKRRSSSDHSGMFFLIGDLL